MIQVLASIALALLHGGISAAAHRKAALTLTSDVSSSFKDFEYRRQCDALRTLGLTPSFATNDREKVIRGPKARLAQTPRFEDHLHAMNGNSCARLMGN